MPGAPRELMTVPWMHPEVRRWRLVKAPIAAVPGPAAPTRGERLAATPEETSPAV
ncbi:hypothetical protein [Streptomyces sp. CBMA123]|uniref:hypothetical protein n=1 Tax=Streptomyces sp. CBMA123 TaxID=1896313 RepID=UPI001661FC46|nr:hypothetical protein [Streptomyces sp. CBMA123]